ncbi:transcription termination/antitermination NusG family protein [Victivallis sp. Marseille-Q1083]|uniref:transcription termination/antitermination NusG family protein n=1 Tax=Victivallis sp. Marseille-Q1083 TaxID=2717288 RepID=UPI00158F5016|nr:transcription termination/antitermination NusG family protein [Victivallis sp. Marseille-Q1083]
MSNAGHNGDEILAMLCPYENTRWMYFVSRPRCEKRLYEGLREQGIPAYLPLFVKTTEYSHRVYKRQVPMFPGYVFASTRSQGFDIQRINSALLKVKFLPEPLADILLNELRLVRKFEILAQDHKLAVKPEIVKDTPVLIRRGAFKGDYAIVEKRKNTETIIVNIQSVQMSLHIELPVDWCEVAGN